VFYVIFVLDLKIVKWDAPWREPGRRPEDAPVRAEPVVTGGGAT